MNTLIKNISASFLLTASALGVMASGSIDTSDSEDNQSSSGTSNISHKRSSWDERSEVDNNQGDSSKKIKIEQGLSTDTTSSQSSSASAASSAENSLSLEIIISAVKRKTFNRDKGKENCLDCSFYFTNYILSGGAECQSAEALPVTDPNFQTFSQNYAQILSEKVQQGLGAPVVEVGDDSREVINLIDPRVGFTGVSVDSLHHTLEIESKKPDPDSVGILFLEYKDPLLGSPANAHFINYLILDGQLMYVDTQVGNIGKTLNTKPFKTAYYRSFPLKKAESIAGVKIKEEPVSYAVTTEVAVSSSSNASVSANNRVFDAAEILRNPTLIQHHAEAAETAMSLLSNASVSAETKAGVTSNIIGRPALSAYHERAAEVAIPLLSDATVSAQNKAYVAVFILKNPALKPHHATAADYLVGLLSDASQSDNRKAVAVVLILKNPALTQHYAAAGAAAMPLLSNKSLPGQLKANIKRLLKGYIDSL
jgi:hypothetical protein